jgi:hypothetical protein
LRRKKEKKREGKEKEKKGGEEERKEKSQIEFSKENPKLQKKIKLHSKLRSDLENPKSAIK